MLNFELWVDRECKMFALNPSTKLTKQIPRHCPVKVTAPTEHQDSFMQWLFVSIWFVTSFMRDSDFSIVSLVSFFRYPFVHFTATYRLLFMRNPGAKIEILISGSGSLSRSDFLLLITRLYTLYATPSLLAFPKWTWVCSERTEGSSRLGLETTPSLTILSYYSPIIFSWYPLVKNCMAVAARYGVFSRPCLCGSSPRPLRMVV